MDVMTRADHDLNEATKYFDEAKAASSPFLRAYYQRVAERYPSSQGVLRLPFVPGLRDHMAQFQQGVAEIPTP
jgi:hypothetical protein